MSEKIACGVMKTLLKWLERLIGIVAESMDNSWLDKMIMSVKLLLEINELLLIDVDIKIRLLVKVHIKNKPVLEINKNILKFSPICKTECGSQRRDMNDK